MKQDYLERMWYFLQEVFIVDEIEKVVKDWQALLKDAHACDPNYPAGATSFSSFKPSLGPRPLRFLLTPRLDAPLTQGRGFFRTPARTRPSQCCGRWRSSPC